MIEEIKNRLEVGYTLSVYGTRELLYGQMEDDINSLLILFDAQKSAIKENNSKLIEYIERKYGIIINRTDLDNFLNREK